MIRSYTLLFLFVLVNIKVFSQSDGCSAATNLTVTANCSSPTNGTSIGATQTITGCVGTADDDVWYKFTATATSHMITVAPSAGMDPVVQLFSGPCASLISISCMDNGMTGESETIYANGLTIGNVYTIRIYHYFAGSGSGTFTTCITTAPTPPSNDNCSNATLTNVNSSCSYTNGTTLGATLSQAGCAGTADDDVWFKFTATNSVQTITVDPSVTMDPVVELFSGTCAGLTSITCMDNGFADGNEVINAVGLIPGNTYYIRVYDYYANTGGAPFQICIVGAATPVPSNDEPCSSIALPAVNSSCNFLNFTTTGATTSVGAPTPASCAGGSAPQQGGFSNAPQPKDVWFSITVPSSGKISITSQPGYGISDAVMSLYSGTCSSLTQIACSDDYNYPGSGNDFKPFILATGLTPGSTVFLRYWAYNGNTTGNFGICVSTPDNDNCSNSLYICNLNGYTGTTNAAYTIDRPCNMRGNAETNNPPTYTYTPGTCQGGIFGLGGAWGTGAPACDVQINNNSWIRFTASNTTATLTVNIYNCFVGSYPSGGIQMQLFSSNGSCCNFTPVSDFKEGSSLLSITANNLTIGNDYYLMIDGFAGDICSYSITASAGVQFTDITTSSTSICAGQTIVLHGPAGSSSYLWSPGGQTTQDITVTPAYSQTYALEVEGVCGDRQSMDIQITVNNLPTPVASSNTPVCTGQSINLTSGGGTTYVWSGPNSFSSTLQNPTLTNATGVMAGTYTVTVTTASGCTSTTTTNVVVNNTPTAVVSNTGPYCNGATIQLNSSGGNSYNWSGPSSFSSTNQNPSITNSTTAMAGTYSVTVTNSNGCTSTNSTNVTINSNPIAVATNTGPFCENSTIQLNGSGGTSYSWTGPGGWTSTSQNPVRNGTTTAMAGTYFLTVTNSNSCTSTSTTVVTVNTNPTVSVSNTGPYCAGETISLSSTAGNTYNWSGPNSWSSSLQNPTLSNAVTTMSGNYSITVTNVNGCSSISSTNVVVNSNPTANAGPDVSIPNGTSTTLSGSASGGSGSYSYNWSPSGSLLSTNVQNPQTTNLSTTTVYTVTVTDNSTGCTSTDMIIVTITGGPLTLSVSSNNNSICYGQSTQLNSFASGGTGSYTYVWTSNPSGFNSSLANPVVSPLVTTTYFVTVSDGFNTTNSSVTVTVNPNPTVSASNTGPYCEGATISLNSSGGQSYSWSAPDGWGNSNQSPSRPASTLTMAGSYSVTITDVNNCTSTATTTVIINSNPIAAAGNTGPYCAGTTIQLNSSGGNSYNWSGPSGWTSNIEDPTKPNATSLMSGTYSVTVTNSNGCSSVSATLVTVYNNPILDAGNNVSIPYGTTTTFNSTVSGGSGNYTFIWNPDTLLINSNIQNPTSVNLNATTTFTVTVTDVATGCTSTDNVTITITGSPLIISPTSNLLTICDGQSITLTTNASGGTGNYTYTWSSYPAGFSSNLASANTSPNINTTYYVTVSDGFNSVNDSVVVTVNPTPTAVVSGNAEYCEEDDFQLNASGGTNYNWSGPSGFSSSLQNPQISNATVNMSGVYSVTVSNVYSCSDTSSTIVTVNDKPITSVSSNGPYCSGDTIMLTVNSATSYYWTGPNAFTSSDQNPVILNAESNYSGTYMVVVTNNYGCTNSGQINVNYPTEINVTGVVTIEQNNHLGNIDITVSGGSNPYEYFWSNGNQSEDLSNLSSGNYLVTITDAGNCDNISSFMVEIPLIIPTVITPNQDGKNDDFEITNIQAYQSVKIEIFNRWGDRLFVFDGSGNEYFVETNRWNGKYNGKDLPLGSYVYIIILDESDPITGVCSIIK